MADRNDGHVNVYITEHENITPLFSNVAQVSSAGRFVQIDYAYLTPGRLHELQKETYQGPDGAHMGADSVARIVMSQEDAEQLAELLRQVLQSG